MNLRKLTLLLMTLITPTFAADGAMDEKEVFFVDFIEPGRKLLKDTDLGLTLNAFKALSLFSTAFENEEMKYEKGSEDLLLNYKGKASDELPAHLTYFGGDIRRASKAKESDNPRSSKRFTALAKEAEVEEAVEEALGEDPFKALRKFKREVNEELRIIRREKGEFPTDAEARASIVSRFSAKEYREWLQEGFTLTEEAMEKL